MRDLPMRSTVNTTRSSWEPAPAAFGTIDGVKSEAAGKVGFTMPDGGDARQYAKLVQYPFDRGWMKYGNLGDHIGMLNPEFSQHVLAPLVLAGLGGSTTQPVAQPPSAVIPNPRRRVRHKLANDSCIFRRAGEELGIANWGLQIAKLNARNPPGSIPSPFCNFHF